jgi:hypothetical protein
MPAIEHFDILILGSGQGGKQLAWHLARMGKKADAAITHLTMAEGLGALLSNVPQRSA